MYVCGIIICLLGSPFSLRRRDRVGWYPGFSRVFSKEVQSSGVKGFTACAVPFNIYMSTPVVGVGEDVEYIASYAHDPLMEKAQPLMHCYLIIMHTCILLYLNIESKLKWYLPPHQCLTDV